MLPVPSIVFCPCIITLGIEAMQGLSGTADAAHNKDPLKLHDIAVVLVALFSLSPELCLAAETKFALSVCPAPAVMAGWVATVKLSTTNSPTAEVTETLEEPPVPVVVAAVPKGVVGSTQL